VNTTVAHPVVFRSVYPSAARTHDDEKQAFLSMLPMLRARHPGKHVIIENGLVADADESRRALVRRFFSQPRYLPVYIGFVGPQRPVRIPTPRIQRQR
jgi:hypothetical protein